MWAVERVAAELAKIGANRVPTDLAAVAEARRVSRVLLQDMVPRGGIVPTEDGFDVYIRHHENKPLDMSRPSAWAALSNRQRFTFAHELAHTFFYDISISPPIERRGIREKTFEKTCDLLAGEILVPAALLSQRLSSGTGVTANAIVVHAREFRVSLEVLLERLKVLPQSDQNQVGILLVSSPSTGEPEVDTACIPAALLPYLSRPRRRTKLTEWCGLSPDRVLDQPTGSWTVTSRSGPVRIVKLSPWPGSAKFLLEARAIDDQPLVPLAPKAE